MNKIAVHTYIHTCTMHICIHTYMLYVAAMNKIAVLPAGLEEIETLEWLELGHNHLVSLTLPDGGLLMLPNLKTLHLEANRILELPIDETQTFESLSAVRSASGSRLTKGIAGLTSLTELRVDCNQLLIVPPDVGRMTGVCIIYTYTVILHSI